MPKVHFIFPRIDCRWPISLCAVGAPSSLISLYSYADSINWGEYEGGYCWDCSVNTEREIFNAIRDGDLVCTTATLTGYAHAVEILRTAKYLGATVVIGGPWVTARGDEIHCHNPWIDYVVKGDGEESLRRILSSDARSGILSHRVPHLSRLPGPTNYSGCSAGILERYAQNYREMIESGEYGVPPKVIPAFAFYQSARGCIQIPRCAFCGVRIGDRLSPRTGEQFYADVKAIRDAHGGRVHIFDASDSFTSSIDRFNGDVHCVDGVTLTAFARADEVTVQSADTLHRLGVTKVSIGIESGSTKALDALGKYTTTQQNARAVRILADKGIQVYLNYMYGLPGETVSSLTETVMHVLSLCEFGNVYRAKGRIVTALPGSRWYRELVRAVPALDTGSDRVDTDEIVKAWLKTRTRVGFAEIDKAHKIFTQGAHEYGVTFSNETAVWFG